MVITNESISNKSLVGAVVQIFNSKISNSIFGLSLLLLDLLLIVANGFLGDFVEKTEDDSGKHEPERDEGHLDVADLEIFLGEVLESEWG